MNAQEVLRLVADLRATCDALEKLASVPEAQVVVPGQSLAQMLADAPTGATLFIDPAFTLDQQLVIDKPVSLVNLNARTLPVARMTADFQLPSFKRGIVVKAPDVTLDALEVTVPNRDQTILVDEGNSTVLHRLRLLGAGGTTPGARRGILTSAQNAVYRRLHVANVQHSQDSQAIVGWDGVDNLEIDDCYLHASGENVMFGGADAQSEARQPKRIRLINSTLEKNPAWAADTTTSCKNLLELKNAQNVLVSGCTMLYSMRDGQDGYAIVLTVRNQSGNNPWASVSNVNISNNHIAHVGGGIQMLGRDDRANYPSGVLSDVIIADNTFEDINQTKWGGSGNSLLLNRGSENLSILRNTFTNEGVSNCFLYLVNIKFPHVGLRIAGNEFDEGRYGIQNDAGLPLGKAAIDAFAPNYLWSANGVRKNVVNGRKIVYPEGTTVR